MNRRKALMSLLLLGTGIGAAAAQGPPPRRSPYPPPPELRHEERGSPRRGHYWQPGHYRWVGGRYLWVGGLWVRGAERRGEYVAGQWRWSPRQQRWAWVPAHWQ
jgi:hypothetical protein